MLELNKRFTSNFLGSGFGHLGLDHKNQLFLSKLKIAPNVVCLENGQLLFKWLGFKNLVAGNYHSESSVHIKCSSKEICGKLPVDPVHNGMSKYIVQ